MDNTIEIIKEARKAGIQAGMQMAWMMFTALVLVLLVFSGLFGYYIYKTYEMPPANIIAATQENESGDNSIQQ